MWRYFHLIKILDLTLNQIRYVHTGDALRLLLIERFGGFYADTDTVMLKSLKNMKNVVASDGVNFNL